MTTKAKNGFGIDQDIVSQCTSSELQKISYEHRFMVAKEFCCLVDRHVVRLASPEVQEIMKEMMKEMTRTNGEAASKNSSENKDVKDDGDDDEKLKEEKSKSLKKSSHLNQVIRVLNRVIKGLGIETQSDRDSLLYEIGTAQVTTVKSGEYSEYGDFDELSRSDPEEDGTMVHLKPRNNFNALRKDLSDTERWVVLWNLLLLSVSDGVYDSRIRVVLNHMAHHLGVPISRFRAAEEGIAIELNKALLDSLKDIAKKNNTSNRNKYWAVGIAGALGGGALLLTGGLAAPFVIPAVGAVIASASGLSAAIGLGAIGAAAATAATTLLTVGGVPMITTLFGVYGASLAGSVMNKRMSGLNTFHFKSISSAPSSPQPEVPQTHGGMQVIITISGLVNDKKDMGQEWIHTESLLEGFGDLNTLIYDPDIMEGLTNVVKNLIVSKIASTLKSFWIGIISTTLSAAISSLTWPLSVLSLTAVVSNPYTLAVDRAEKCGRLLAKVLYEDHVQGNRPVTLVGSSLGARAIFYCCEELAKNDQKGIIENIFLIGAPVSTDPSEEQRWVAVRSVVAGRLVNAYSKNDWVLATLYRVMNLSFNVAGLFPIDKYDSLRDNQIENIDLAGLVESHFDYTKPDRMKHILAQLQLEDSVVHVE